MIINGRKLLGLLAPLRWQMTTVLAEAVSVSVDLIYLFNLGCN